MTLLAHAEFDSRAPTRIVDSPFPIASESHCPVANHNARGDMHTSLGKNERRFRGDPRPNISIRDAKERNADWLAEQASRESAKRIGGKTGLTSKAVENIRQHKNKISFDNLVEWCQNDPTFAAAFAEHVGLILPGEAEFAGALTQAFNAYQRKTRTD